MQTLIVIGIITCIAIGELLAEIVMANKQPFKN